MVCYNCGILFEEEDTDQFWTEDVQQEVGACIVKCPHCETIGEIQTYGGIEQCGECGLDPNVENYSSNAIAHLWKSRDEVDIPDNKNQINDVMMRPSVDSTDVGTPARKIPFGPEMAIGKFLRKECGPHCTYGISCPQSMRNLVRCWLEVKEDERDMGRRRGKRKKSKKQHANTVEDPGKKAKRAARKALHSRSWLISPPKGWFASCGKYKPESS
jgi:hypothetical protein